MLRRLNWHAFQVITSKVYLHFCKEIYSIYPLQSRSHRNLPSGHGFARLFSSSLPAAENFIDVNRARELAVQAGWGRIHVARMPSEHASYLAKYLSKQRLDLVRTMMSRRSSTGG